MTRRFDQVAFAGMSKDSLKDAVERELGLAFVAHYSDDWGGDYWNTRAGSPADVSIVPNFADEDGVLLIEGHPELLSVLDAVDLTAEQAAILIRLGGVDVDTLERPPVRD